MSNGRFYFSEQTPEDCIWDSSPYMTFIFIPNKWWSIKAWKMAIDLRKNFTLIGLIKDG